MFAAVAKQSKVIASSCPASMIVQDQPLPICISSQADNIISNFGCVELPDTVFHTWINGLPIVRN